MRLSGIKLAGFKSFVDPSHLPLPGNLTSVVGPNGCGKSNLIDAVRWVLGEASIKNLRGTDSEDVIFNGSRTRKPAGRASVELQFDNSDQQITGPYAAYTDIAVKRELTRDGGSQYYLNGAKCLKRDVTDLFLGTGLGGKNQYAIIEQGMVSRMVEAKPEELRHWLEEAAGISKYKERRRETESRIRGARENLSRLNDLQSELHSRLEVLARQAADAEKYKTFKEQERRLKAELLLLRLRALDAQATAHEAAIADLEQALDAARSAVSEADRQRALSELAQREAGALLNAEQGQVYEAEAALARHEQALAHAREMQTLRQRELDRLQAQLAELVRRREGEELRQQSLTEAVAQARVGESETHEASAQQALATAEQSLADEQHRWEEFSQRSQAPLLEAEGERVRVQGMERAALQLDERLRRLQTERSGLDATPIQASLFDVDNELGVLERQLGESQEKLQTADRELQVLRDQRAEVEKTLHASRQALADARGRQGSLETLQQAALREDDVELAAWLRRSGFADLPRLATSLSVEAGWESAVEHVLAFWLQAPLVDGRQLPARPPETAALPKSGAAFLSGSADSISVSAEHLASKVSGPAALTELLHGIYLAEDADVFERLAASLRAGESVINREGVWRGLGWSRYPNRDPDHSGVIARGRMLKQLQQQVAEHAASVAVSEAALSELRARQTQMENDRRTLAQVFDQSRGKQAQRLAHRQAQAVRLEQTQGRLNTLTQEFDALSAQRSQHAQEFDATRARLVQLERTAEALRNERVERNRTLVSAREAVQGARAGLQRSAQARGQAQVHLAAQTSALGAVTQALASLAEQSESLAAQRAAGESAGLDFEEPIRLQSAEAETARGVVQAARERLRSAREKLIASETAVSEAVRHLRETEAGKEAAQERLQQARLEFENLRARREALDAQFAETGYSRAELAAGLDENAAAPAWEDELARVVRRIERLGAINLAAIQELDEARTREAYLSAQHADIADALATLEEAMRKLDHETESRFKETFDTVNGIFKARFPQLFGGGEAYLELTGDDLLETGIRVMARPPGKRNSSIQLLSGGEKAMTAVALLLALFQLNPAPFCLMDEVDAPLDDANVGRFCEVVREMAHAVQFIIITHNKITMELAEQLHGVTMQEPGVSRLVSVDVKQAVQLAGVAEARKEPNESAKAEAI
ncbi:MAG: smc [Nevskia sp.]|nr:smc [Nevskia sp.]